MWSKGKNHHSQYPNGTEALHPEAAINQLTAQATEWNIERMIQQLL